MRTLPAAIVAVLAAGNAFAADITWKESRYNPKPAAGDLVLPTPCGGAMVFRKVVTPHAEGGLNDVAVEIGADADEFGYLRGRRKAHVSGPFRDADGFLGYYIAKYEVARAQFDVVMGEACPERKPRKKDFVPAVELTWFDAMTFTARYSIWLNQNAADALPKVEEVSAHLRLPTEVEWEYAARGGAIVGAADFREPLYPMGQATLAEHEAYGDTGSANGKVQPIGSLKPNPLGLHDMLGNVAELTLEPFRMVRHGRPHGRVGGFVKRGADANTELGGISASARQEIRFYDPTTGEAVRDRYVGFRPVLTAIAIDSEEAIERYARASIAAAAPDLQTDIGEEEARALVRLEEAAAIESPGERRDAMLTIARTLDSARAERNEQRDRAIESLFLAAASTCATSVQQLRTRRHFLRRERDALAALEPIRTMKARGELTAENLAELAAAEERFLAIPGKISEVNERLGGYMRTYAEFIATLQADYGPDVTDPQADLLRGKLDTAGPPVLGLCLGVSTAHVSDARATGRLKVDEWLEDIESIIDVERTSNE